MTLKVESFWTGTLKLGVYGEDEVLTRNRRKASSRPKPGRWIHCIQNNKKVWSTLHEAGNRKLLDERNPKFGSFVRNFFNIMVMQAMDSDTLTDTTYAAGSLALKATCGGSITSTTPVDIGDAGVAGSGYRGASADASTGLQAGTGTTAFSFDDFVLATLIAEGTGSGQMSYVAQADYTLCSAEKVLYTGGCTRTWTTTYERFMNNNSGGAIDVKEVSIVTEPAGTNTPIMVARDLLGCCNVCIADTGQLKVTYTITSPQFTS